MMDESQIKKIVGAMEGMTYSEWNKIKHVIDVKFSAEASRTVNKIVIPSADEIVENFKRLF